MWITVIGPSVTVKPSPHTRVDLAPLFGATSDSPHLDLFVIFSVDFGTGAAGEPPQHRELGPSLLRSQILVSEGSSLCILADHAGKGWSFRLQLLIGMPEEAQRQSAACKLPRLLLPPGKELRGACRQQLAKPTDDQIDLTF